MAGKPELFSHIASGIQSIVLSIAVIVGGWWAMQTFVFQNPSFYEEGGMVAGSEKEFVSGSIEVFTLSEYERIFEVKVEIKNRSSQFAQSVQLSAIPLFVSRVRQSENGASDLEEPFKIYAITANNDSGIDSEIGIRLRSLLVAKMQTRDVLFLLNIPEPGVYLVEFNPCQSMQESCIIQRYIHVI